MKILPYKTSNGCLWVCYKKKTIASETLVNDDNFKANKMNLHTFDENLLQKNYMRTSLKLYVYCYCFATPE